MKHGNSNLLLSLGRMENEILSRLNDSKNWDNFKIVSIWITFNSVTTSCSRGPHFITWDRIN